MFSVNDYIVYGSNGVCKIEDICIPPEVDEVHKNKKYYVLKPIYSKGNTIYTPIDNTKVVIRKIISKEETEKLIDSIPSIKTLEVSNDKERTEKCQTALRSCDYKEWIRVIKTMYIRKQERIGSGKHFGQTDERLLHSAEDFLYGELAVPLEIPKEQVEDYITKRIEKLENKDGIILNLV